jgi:hypothetical protein
LTNPCLYRDELGKDPDQAYEKLLNGGIAPARLVGYQNDFSPLCYPRGPNGMSTAQVTQVRLRSSISRLPSIKLVITSDKSQWTRCPVIEMGRDSLLNIGGNTARPGRLRQSTSVDKNGNQMSGKGMGWFPGYAIDMEKGVRLYMAFGENSFLGSDGGSDMIWNPSSRLVDNVGNPIMGGQQPIYVFGYQINETVASGQGCPEYTPAADQDENNWLYNKMVTNTANDFRDVYMNLCWIANPILADDQKVLSSNVEINVGINKEYTEFVATGKNGGRPMYGWSMDDIATRVGSQDQLADALKLINVVPNPYYAYSAYERSRYDNRVRITNLPDVCTIRIYNLQGKLIKTYKKSAPITFQDWTLKNEAEIPVASGIYMIHVDVPNVGEALLKLFVGMRAPDFENL